MKKVEIYTTTYCPYCIRAKQTLTELKIPFTEIDITENEDQSRKKLGKDFDIEGTVTVPQIIIGGKRVGGLDNLEELIADNDLQELLKD